MLNPKLLSEAFPINKVEVFFDAEDHSDFLGFQWEMISQGRIPIGLDESDIDFNTIGKTGGEKEVTLTVEQIPPHQHETYLNYDNGSVDVPGWTTKFMYAENPNQTKGSKSKGVLSAGGGQPHNNMPPYIVMAFWKRIA